jgi:hypothetical protein
MDDDSKLMSLPLEILNKIRSYLNYRSMCSLLLVSRWWKEVWENPLLWSGFDLGDYGDNFYPACYWEFTVKPRDLNNLENILNTKRFSELKILGIPILNEDFLAVIRKHPNIRCLEFVEVDEGLDKDDFAELLVSLESIKFYGKDGLDDDDADEHSCENKEQLTALFEKMLDDEGKTTKIKKTCFRL